MFITVIHILYIRYVPDTYVCIHLAMQAMMYNRIQAQICMWSTTILLRAKQAFSGNQWEDISASAVAAASCSGLVSTRSFLLSDRV